MMLAVKKAEQLEVEDRAALSGVASGEPAACGSGEGEAARPLQAPACDAAEAAAEPVAELEPAKA